MASTRARLTFNLCFFLRDLRRIFEMMTHVKLYKRSRKFSLSLPDCNDQPGQFEFWFQHRRSGRSSLAVPIWIFKLTLHPPVISNLSYKSIFNVVIRINSSSTIINYSIVANVQQKNQSFKRGMSHDFDTWLVGGFNLIGSLTCWKLLLRC